MDTEPAGAIRRGSRTRRQVVTWGIRASVLGVVAAAGLTLAWFTLPTATVTLTPALVQLPAREVTIVASPDTPDIDATAGTIPALRRLYPLTTTATFDVATIRDVLTRATGSVRFTSQNTITPVLIDKGTRLWSSDGTAYRTLMPVTLRRWNSTRRESRPSVEVPVAAVKPGPAGNARPGTITVVPTTLQTLRIRVSNPSAITGGTRTAVRQVSRADCSRARRTLRAALEAEFAAVLQRPATPGLHLFPESGQLGTVAYSPDCEGITGRPMDVLELSATTTATALEVDESVLDAVVARQFVTSADPATRVDAGSIRVVRSGLTVSRDAVTYLVSVSGRGQPPLDPARIQEEIAGRPASEARAILGRYGEATLVIWPDVVPDVPPDLDRITLVVQRARTEP